jgi:hypothetical protein
MLRSEVGVELALARPDLRIILSGDGRILPEHRGAKPEASHMSRYFKRRGVSSQQLLVEDESVDTIGNALLVSARYLHGAEPGKLIIITSPFHAERARLAFAGVLDPRWEIEVVVSQSADDDDVRAATEHGGVEWTRRFYQDIAPGDLSAALVRLGEVGKDVYRANKRLARAKRRALRQKNLSSCG